MALTKTMLEGATLTCLNETRAQIQDIPLNATYNETIRGLVESHPSIDLSETILYSEQC